MRPIRRSALARLRAPVAVERPASPLQIHRPQNQAVCILCAHRQTAARVQRRYQSSASTGQTASSSTPPNPSSPPHPTPETTDTRSPNESTTQPQTPTHYDLFPGTLSRGPPPHGPFAISLQDLHREFLHHQRSTHPDLHPPPLRSKYQALSATLNTAYKTLQSPLLRAQYLLSLRGIDAADEAGSVEDEELLMEVLEAREGIEDVESEEEVRGLKEENEGRIKICEEGLEEAFGRDDLEGAKGLVVRLRYWVNVKEALEGWEKGKPVVLEH